MRTRHFLVTCLIFLVFSTPIVSATPLTNRLSGLDRYQTAQAIAKDGWDESDYAILAYGENYPDALAAAPLAKAYNAPILLTSSTTLQNDTKQTLIDLKTKKVFIVGGHGVVLPQVETELSNMGITATRLAGADRYETAVKISEQLGPIKEIFVVTGEDYPDALSVAPIAAKKNMPILLVPRDGVPESVKNYINSQSITKTYIIGQADTISFEAGNQFPNTERIIGSDRFERNVAIIKQFKADLNTDYFCVATGDGFADALTGSAYAAKKSAPILLISNDVPSFTREHFKERLGLSKSVIVFGGEGVVPSTLLQQLGSSNSLYTPSEIAQQLSPSIVYIEMTDLSGKAISSGSGFIIDSSGKIVTNQHVISGASGGRVVLSDKTSYEISSVSAADASLDIAIIQINTSGLQPAKLGNSETILAGEKVVAIGNPYGLDHTISDGLISNVSREINGETLIQTSAPISPGSSGGALINERSEVIGVTSSGYNVGQNLNFAIPINKVKPLMTANLNLTLAAYNKTNVVQIPSNTPTQTTRILSDAELENDLNTNYAVLALDGKEMRFRWKVNDYKPGDVANSITGLIEPSDHLKWLDLLIEGKSARIKSQLGVLTTRVQMNYPSKSLYIGAIYQDYYYQYPSGYNSKDITYDSYSGRWLVTKVIISILDNDGIGELPASIDVN